jgi:Na+/glutamate symporter
MAEPHATFGLFVSCVDGQPVTRFGTGTMIGAARSKATPDVVTYDPTHVVGIPHAEYDRHRRSYDRALGNGSLKARSAADYRAQEQAQAKRDDENRKAQARAAKAKPASAGVSLDQTDPAAGDPPA